MKSLLAWLAREHHALLLCTCVCNAALHALLVSGDSRGAAQGLADLASEVQRVEPSNAALMAQLVSMAAAKAHTATCASCCLTSTESRALIGSLSPLPPHGDSRHLTQALAGDAQHGACTLLSSTHVMPA